MQGAIDRKLVREEAGPDGDLGVLLDLVWLCGADPQNLPEKQR